MVERRDTVYAQTITPNRQGVNISKEKYDTIYRAIIKVLKINRSIQFGELARLVEKHLKRPFDGSIAWYTTTVKLDMEKRGIIERIPDEKPQRLRMVR